MFLYKDKTQMREIMWGLDEFLIQHAGTLFSFTLFLGERAIQFSKDKTVAEQKIDDSTIRDYLEWRRRKDQGELKEAIKSQYEDLLVQAHGLSYDFEKALSKIQNLLATETDDLQRKFDSLNTAIVKPVFSSTPLNCRNIQGDLLSRENEYKNLLDLPHFRTTWFRKNFSFISFSKKLECKVCDFSK
jgi:hypothetical protein